MHGFEIDAVIALIRKRHALKSNWAVAEYLQITHQSLGNWLKGRSYPDPRMCAKLGAASGLDSDLLTVFYQAKRTSGEEQEIWLRIARRLAGKDSAAEKFAAAFAITSVAAKAEPDLSEWPLLPEFGGSR